MRVSLPSLAKLNLDLRVLWKRPDGFHEVRTIYQTISLRDTIELEYSRSRRTTITLDSSIDIPDNLVVRAAHLVLEHLKLNANIHIALRKTIPMGAGLGGGSSNAAAVLAALPALAGKLIPMPDLVRLGTSLGSDVPFFFYGGTALGLGRGTELYPLPDQPPAPIVVFASGIHVSTASAYQALNRPALNEQNALTSPQIAPILGEFQNLVWQLQDEAIPRLILRNDFEAAVFQQHPSLASSARRLRKAGAKLALMTGSGSALFGIFENAAQAKSVARKFDAARAIPGRFVTRQRYRSLWASALGPALPFSCFANRRGERI